MFSYMYLQITRFTSMGVDSKICRIYFHTCWFLESEREVDLRKIILLQNWWCTNRQYDLAKYSNSTLKS